MRALRTPHDPAPARGDRDLRGRRVQVAGTILRGRRLRRECKHITTRASPTKGQACLSWSTDEARVVESVRKAMAMLCIPTVMQNLIQQK
jgi:hypothetical protein